jgi:hypothetical protein
VLFAQSIESQMDMRNERIRVGLTTMSSEPTDATNPTHGTTSRSIISLLLVAHLFFVGVCLLGNFAPSSLLIQVLDKFKFYTRLLNFDLNYTPYHLTHADESDVDHRIEVLPTGKDASRAGDWILLSSEGFRGCDSYKRYQRMAATWAYQAQNEGDPAIFAQTIGTYFARERNILPAQVRCRRHFLQSRTEITGGTAARRDPDDASYFSVVYAANTIVGESGHVGVVRIDEAGQVAQPTGERRSAPTKKP